MHAMPGVVASAKKEQAARDWKSILQARSGSPVDAFVRQLCVSKEDTLANRWCQYVGLLSDCLGYKEQNLIDEDERLVYSNYYRTKKEFFGVC
jgi:hypothetical protein